MRSLLWIVILAGLVGGGWIFLHPKASDLRAELTAPMEPIDARTGVYQTPEGGLLLAAPAIEGGFRLYVVDHWARARQFASGEKGSFKREDESLAFSRDFLAVEGGEEGGLHAERLSDQPYVLRHVRIRTDVDLDAWIFEPAAPNGVGAVILHGSGDSDRSNAWYVFLAHEVARSGVTAILPDKRGSGRSGGDWRNSAFELLSDDGGAWLDLLRQENPNLSRYGFLGVSQGGSIAPLAARKAAADFAIALSAAGTTMKQQLATEVGNDVAAGGVPAIIAPLMTKAFSARAMGRYPQFWRANGDYDMLAEWRRWGGPFFIAYGRRDEADNVPVAKSTARLETEFANAPNLSWRVYEGVGHSLIAEDDRFVEPLLSDLGKAMGQ